MDISIIIVSYNVWDFLRPCLESIMAQKDDLSLEVIVVDNASVDGTPDFVRQYFPEVKLIANPDNRGFPAANNQGFAISQGRYILMLNPDTLTHPGALLTMVQLADSLPDGGVWGARTVNGKGNFDLTCRPFPTVLNVLCAHFQLRKLFPGILENRYAKESRMARQPMQVDWVQGSCLMFRREVREVIGDLDPQFFLFAEEVDFCYRAKEAGYITYYLPAAIITHFGSRSTVQNIPFKIRSHHMSKLRFFRKHKGVLALLVLRLGFLVELGVKTIVRLAEMLVRRRPETAVYLRAYWETARECLSF